MYEINVVYTFIQWRKSEVNKKAYRNQRHSKSEKEKLNLCIWSSVFWRRLHRKALSEGKCVLKINFQSFTFHTNPKQTKRYAIETIQRSILINAKWKYAHAHTTVEHRRNTLGRERDTYKFVVKCVWNKCAQFTSLQKWSMMKTSRTHSNTSVLLHDSELDEMTSEFYEFIKLPFTGYYFCSL